MTHNIKVNCLADTPGSGIASRGDCPLGSSLSLSCLLLLMTKNQSESQSRKYLWTFEDDVFSGKEKVSARDV